MKKFIIIAIVVIALGASPLIMGHFARGALEADLQTINQMPGYKAEIVEYQSGYQKAIAKIRVGYDIDPSMIQDLPADSQAMLQVFSDGIVIDVDVTHGPVILSPKFQFGLMHATGELSKDQEFVRQALEMLDVDYLFRYEVDMGYFGQGTANFSIPSFSFAEGLDQFQFGGVTAVSNISDFGKSYDVNGSIGEIAVRAEGVNAVMAPAQFSGNGKNGESYIDATGDFTVTLPSINVSGMQSGQIQNLGLHVVSRESSATSMGVDYDFTIKRIEGFALGRTLSDLQFSMTMENLDKSALMALTKMSTDITALESGEQEIMQVMSDLLHGSPQVLINNLGFTVNDTSTVKVSGQFSVKGDMLTDPVDFVNPMAMIPALAASLDASIDRALINEAIMLYSAQQVNSLAAQLDMSEEDQQQMLQQQSAQFNQMLDGFVQQGLVEKSGNSYVVKASFQNGELMVNGNPLRL